MEGVLLFVYLKRIEIAGFKSFAERTVIEFERGVTAVVGPNGSGKSNITEAIRWVLGEQSAKSLRGGKMPDIIFAGAQNRKPLNIAEVTVVLENSDHFLPLDFTEISVTRRYRRTGESDFYINKQACRLKDIHELFMDSGLGRESFSIISQGKVEAIFNSKPEDRRGIFEEAAGVLKYKQRKKKAEQKLFETEDNLSRVQDIIYELAEQLIPLEQQSKVANNFLMLKEELTKIDVQLTTHEIIKTKAIWEEKQSSLTVLGEKLQEASRKIYDLEEVLSQLKSRRNRVDQNIENQQQQLLQMTELLKQTEGQKQVLVERSKHMQQSTNDSQFSLKEITDQLINYRLELNELQQKIEQKQRQKQQLVDWIELSEQEVEKYSKSSKELLEELRSQYVETMQEQANTNNELKYLERQYQQESVKNQQAIQKHEALESQLEQAIKINDELEKSVSKLEQTLSQQRENYLSEQEQLKRMQLDLENKQKQMYQSMNLVQQIKARQKSLQEIQENYSGFYQGVRLILKHRNQLNGIVGAVAELIEVPNVYTLAIETALGATMQHVVVEEEKDGREGITFLKKQRGGRATFLPLTTLKPRNIPNKIVERMQEIPGFLGIASNLVHYETRLTNIMQNLLGTTVLAENLESANCLAQSLNYQYRVVSLEGDIMNAGGSMTGGANKKGSQGSIFSQTQELQSLTEKLVQVQEQSVSHETNVQKIMNEIQKKEIKVDKLRTEGETIRFKQQEYQNKQTNQTDLIVRLKKEKGLFEFESNELHQFLTDYQQKKERLIQQQNFWTDEKERLNQEMQQIDQEASQMEEKKLAAIERYNQLQADRAVVTEQLVHFNTQQKEKQHQIDDAIVKKGSLNQQLQTLNDSSSNHQQTEQNLTIQIKQYAEKKAELEEAITKEKNSRQSLQEQMTECESCLAEENKQQQELLTEQTKEEVEKNRAEMKLDTALQYLQEEYNITFERAATQYQPINDQEISRQKVKQLKREIDRLGPVNIASIDQYEQVNSRHEFLVTQRDDLLNAKNQLSETMNEMDEEVKIRFNETFEAIRTQFKLVFPNMFGGGRAELMLTDPNDLLNTGIEIEAQPPGKRLQSLSLLSGGERALTAIALLFSILRVRPVPFCVLDEVEAALDDANVVRFGRYLSNFEAQTQFIVVTHRKGTMEAANALYGVTMQESGISKIVSVRLEEIKESGTIES